MMEFIFEDEVDEVGSDVEAYCPKCKADTTHVVISKYEDEIRRVQCNPCGDVHSYRKPRGEVEDDIPEPIAAKKRAMLRKPTWEEFFAKRGEKDGKPYNFVESYAEHTIVTHPKFGLGFVSEVLSESKVEITFRDTRRVLVHNRSNMPGLPLAAEGDGVSSGSKAARALRAQAKNGTAVKPKLSPAAAKPVRKPASKPPTRVADAQARRTPPGKHADKPTSPKRAKARKR